MRFFKPEDFGVEPNTIVITQYQQELNGSLKPINTELDRGTMVHKLAKIAFEQSTKISGYENGNIKRIQVKSGRMHDVYIFPYLQTYAAMAATELMYPKINQLNCDLEIILNAQSFFRRFYTETDTNRPLLRLSDANGIVQDWLDAKAIVGYHTYLRADYGQANSPQIKQSFISNVKPLEFSTFEYYLGAKYMKYTEYDLFWNLKHLFTY